MENEKRNNNGLVALVIVLVLLVLALGGYIVYDKVLSNNNNQTNSNNANTNNNEIDTDQKSGDTDSATITENNDDVKIDNKDLTSSDLNNVLDILGITKYDNDSSNNNSCLNYYLSDNNFRNNSKFIFGWYSRIHRMGSNTAQTVKLIDYDNDGTADIAPCGGASDCGSIEIKNANKIIDLYKLTSMNEHFSEMPAPYKDKEYMINYYELIELHPYFCNIVVKHDLSAKYSINRNIEVIDNQKVITYKKLEDLKEENIESTANKTVTYNLKKDSSNNYYLDTVIVQ